MGATTSQVPGRTTPAPMSPDSLTGTEGQQAPGQGQGDMQAALQRTLAQFRDLEATVTALAGQHPEIAQDARAVINGLRNMMMRVTQKMTRGQAQETVPMAT